MKLAAAALIVLAVVGAVVAVVSADSTVGTAVAIALVGCAAVGGVALAFFAVGDAEDRDRAESCPAARARARARTSPAGRSGWAPDRKARRPPRRAQAKPGSRLSPVPAVAP